MNAVLRMRFERVRAMPKLELTKVASMPSYPLAVRQAARRIQGR
jgi:hypothetical protein